MATASDKVTIYYKGPGGNILQQEGHFVRVEDRGPGRGADVVFRPRRGRRERVIESYYHSFWMVVEGWEQPTPDSLFVDPVTPVEPNVATSGVIVRTGRYRSTDPRWVSDFCEGVGKRLTVRAVFHNRTLQFDPGTAPCT